MNKFHYNKTPDFYYYSYKGKLLRMYKKEFIQRRAKELGSGQKDPILERFRAGLILNNPYRKENK